MLTMRPSQPYHSLYVYSPTVPSTLPHPTLPHPTLPTPVTADREIAAAGAPEGRPAACTVYLFYLSALAFVQKYSFCFVLYNPTLT